MWARAWTLDHTLQVCRPLMSTSRWTAALQHVSMLSLKSSLLECSSASLPGMLLTVNTGAACLLCVNMILSSIAALTSCLEATEAAT